MVNTAPLKRNAPRPRLMANREGWFKGRGTLVYDPKRNNKKNTDWWLVVEVDREITRYFRWFVDRELVNMTGDPDHGVLQPSGDAHISVIRGWNDVRRVPKDELTAMWKKYQGQEVDFLYSPIVKTAKGEFWYVNVECPFLTDIRREFDLPYDYGMHLTIGRMRNYWLDEYDGRLRNFTWTGRS